MNNCLIYYLEIISMAHYYWAENKTLILNLRVTPGAKKTFFSEISDGVLRIKLNAISKDNEANVALINFLAKSFGTSKSQVAIISGSKSRLKRVSIVDPKILPPEAEIK